jgi:putative acetyltransferase
MASPGGFDIIEGGLDREDVVDMLRMHVDRARAETGRGSAHALDLSGLKAPDIRFWSVRENGVLACIGALRQLSPDHGELKSMYAAEAARGHGAATALLTHIVAEARQRKLTRLSLETGSWAYFDRARAFYTRHGFVPCRPFGDYVDDPNSAFLTLSL